MTLSTVLAAAALACPQEARLQSMLPDVAAICSAEVCSERQNDFCWENDKFGMRAYGPGEHHKWSGWDVFNKAVDAEATCGYVLHNHDKCGNWHETPYKGILDNYTMGASRGVGGIAFWGDGEWKTYVDWDASRVIHAGDDRCEFELVYPAFSAAGKMTCHVTLRRGERFFRCDVSFEHPERFRSDFRAGPGIDLDPGRGHKGVLVEEDGLVSLFEDEKGANGSTMEAIFVAPGEKVEAMTDRMNCRVLAFGKPSFTYWAGATWSKAGEITTPEAWIDAVRSFRKCVAKDSDLMAAVAVSSPGLEPGDERALADRLFMHWNTHATDVFVRDEAVVGVGGARADVPTVMFAGNRSHVTQFRRPKLAELPRRFEDERGIWLEPVDGGEKTFVPYGKTGCIISSVNREIVSKARDAARKWAKDGDEFSARLAFNVLDTYLAGILARNVATDLGRGHMQTLFGLQSMETIHDDVIHEITELYSLLLPWLEKNAADRIDVYKAALRKWADVQIANGVADNNWDMMQLNYILEIGLALGGDDKAHYVDVVMNQSSVRNYSVKKLAETGFDPETGIWWECPGYSVGVTLKDFAKFATRAKKDLGIDLLEEVPVLKKAFPAAGEYLFPDGLLIGFGDTHPSRIPDEVLAYAQPKTSPFFYAPNASWLVARSGMDPTNDVAFALNGSLGNHQHANGISLELYARGYRLAPDAGIGWSLYSGDDYKEYYSQFPAHNTVMVDSRSTYQVMKSFHPFELVAHGENWATVKLREPATNAEQERTVRYVKDGEGAYFVDVFRSRAKGARWHDYYYHNFGDTLSLNGETEPTEEIAFVESGLYALSYIKDKEARKGRGDLVATFDWARPEGIVTTRLFMNDAEGRTFIRATAPATEGLSRVKSPDYGITRDSRTPCLVVRQRGEAWDRPFVAVIDPCGTVKGVEFLADAIRVTRPSGKVDTIQIKP